MKKRVTRERFRKALPRAIVLLREARGLTQAQLSRKLEISSATMCRYEKGDYKPGVIRLAHILEVLECDFGDLDAALKQVWASEVDAIEPLPELLLQSEASEHEKLLAAYATAAAHGRGDELVERAIRQAQALSRMRRYMSTYERSWQERLQERTGDSEPREENDVEAADDAPEESSTE